MPGPSSDSTKADLHTELSSRLVMAAPVFAGVAVIGLAFLVLLGLLLVVSATYPRSSVSVDDWLNRGWAMLSAVALLWALVNLFWGRQAAGSANSAAAYGHVALAIGCGLIALGIHSVLFARALGSQPVVMDYSHWATPIDSGTAAAVVMAQGNAEEGQIIFSTSCITCHGPTGGGIPNLAPSLRGSEFVASADDAAVASLIRLGRLATDPNNKSKKVMPARGGNPFLGDDKIVHLVAFIRKVQSAGAGAAVADATAPPPVQLARWVVPAGPAPPLGMISLSGHADIGDDLSLTNRDQRRRNRLSQALVLGLTGIHGLFLLGVMVASSDVLLRRLTEDDPPTQEYSWWNLSLLSWIVAAVAWLVVLMMGFVWL